MNQVLTFFQKLNTIFGATSIISIYVKDNVMSVRVEIPKGESYIRVCEFVSATEIENSAFDIQEAVIVSLKRKLGML